MLFAVSDGRFAAACLCVHHAIQFYLRPLDTEVEARPFQTATSSGRSKNWAAPQNHGSAVLQNLRCCKPAGRIACIRDRAAATHARQVEMGREEAMQVMQDNPAVFTCGELLANETPADIVSTAKLRKVLDAAETGCAVIVVLAVGGVIARPPRMLQSSANFLNPLNRVGASRGGRHDALALLLAVALHLVIVHCSSCISPCPVIMLARLQEPGRLGSMSQFCGRRHKRGGGERASVRGAARGGRPAAGVRSGGEPVRRRQGLLLAVRVCRHRRRFGLGRVAARRRPPERAGGARGGERKEAAHHSSDDLGLPNPFDETVSRARRALFRGAFARAAKIYFSETLAPPRPRQPLGAYAGVPAFFFSTSTGSPSSARRHHRVLVAMVIAPPADVVFPLVLQLLLAGRPASAHRYAG